MDPTSQNHNTLITDPNGSNFPKSQHFDQRSKWIQLTKITTLWSETQMDPTSQNHNTLIRAPNGSNFPKSQHFDQRPKMDPTSQNHNTLIRDPKWIQLPKITTIWSETQNASNFPESQHFDQRPKMHPTSRKPSQKNNILMWVLGVLIHDAISHSLVAWKFVFLILGATIFWPGLIIALPNKNTLPIYLSTLAQFNTNYIVFTKCWKFSKIISSKSKNIVKGKNKWIF